MNIIFILNKIAFGEWVRSFENEGMLWLKAKQGKRIKKGNPLERSKR
jgi:hypothetical protein